MERRRRVGAWPRRRTGDTKEITIVKGDEKRPDHDDRASFDAPSGLAAVPRSRAVRVDATGEPGLLVYRTGPYHALVGRRVADVPGGPRAQFGADLAAPGVIRTAKGNWRPAAVSGTLTAGEPPGTLAVSVDGVIGAVTTAVDQRSLVSFWAVLPGQLLPDGRHRLALYLVEGPPAAPVLRPVPIEGS